MQRLRSVSPLIQARAIVAKAESATPLVERLEAMAVRLKMGEADDLSSRTSSLSQVLRNIRLGIDPTHNRMVALGMVRAAFSHDQAAQLSPEERGSLMDVFASVRQVQKELAPMLRGILTGALELSEVLPSLHMNISQYFDAMARSAEREGKSEEAKTLRSLPARLADAPEAAPAILRDARPLSEPRFNAVQKLARIFELDRWQPA